MEVRTTRRERKKQATRDALRRAALELYLDRGVGGVTVEEIAEQADVAPSTFFRHFPTKESVVFADYGDRRDDLLAALDAEPPDAPLSEVLTAAIQGWQRTRREPEVLRAEARLLADEPALMLELGRILSGWEGPIAARLADRTGRDADDLEVRLVAAWLLTAIRVVIREWSVGDRSSDVFGLGARALQLLGPAADRLAADD